MASRSAILLALAAACCAFCPRPAAAAKVDVVHLRNGDRLTGEIKQLEAGQLTLSTDAMGKVVLIWEDVARLDSPQFFEVELDSGEKLYGSLAGDAALEGDLEVRGEGTVARAPLATIVRIVPLSQRGRPRRDGSLDLGMTLAQANDFRELSLGLSMRARTAKYRRKIELDSFFSEETGAEGRNRHSATLDVRRFLRERRTFFLAGEALRNDELGIEWRALVAAGLGRYFVKTSQTEAGWILGLAANEERFAGEGSADASLEALLGLEYWHFRLHTPKSDARVSLFVLPSLTVSDRVRAELEAYLRRELVKDFFVSLRLYDSFDSRPPEGLEENDWGLTTAVGWSW